MRSALIVCLWWFLALNGRPIFPADVVRPFETEEDCVEIVAWLNDEVWRQAGWPELFVGPYQCVAVDENA